MFACVFASCGKKVVSGSYKAEIQVLGQSYNVTYTFSGNKVEAESKLSVLGFETTKNVAGTYEIISYDDGDLEIKFDFEDESGIFKDGTHSFMHNEDYITIYGIKYPKVN